MDKLGKFKEVASGVVVVAIPITAFLIRMFEGDTRNESEEVISRTLKRTWEKFKIYINNQGD